MSRYSLEAEQFIQEERIPHALVEGKRSPLDGPTYRIRTPLRKVPSWSLRSCSRRPCPRRDSVESLALILSELQSISSQGLTGDAISPAQRTEVIHKARGVLQRKLREEEPYTSLELVGMAALVVLAILLPLACWFKFG
ncbi:hypothetical protein DUNSADRAFT_5308 [Dunaliella salina]|uniref:Encoded protein n=1 Tax=Dunaliella salina TaxID=3046 RepID=A0ABQ7GQI4_DUNSA|nr:hypothetical protein DUNSADRAFT_5308 [Dunaliella salina]|eukprot:KAF5836869.1 hypothetical protein DUNSADRAFT_5308 [Dunaliella salina]